MSKAIHYLLSTENKEFVGAGKIMYDSYSNDYNIPHLHFLVEKVETDLYQACNLEFSLFAIGKNVENAVAELVELTIKHIDSVMQISRGFEELHKTAISHVMDNYWAEYRNIEFKSALCKQDIGHNVEQRFSNIIRNIINEKMQEELIKIVEKEAKNHIKEIKDSIKRINKYSFNILYQQVAA